MKWLASNLFMSNYQPNQQIMKKLLLTASVVFFMFSCQKDENVSAQQDAPLSTLANRGCASQDVLERQLIFIAVLNIEKTVVIQIANSAFAKRHIVSGESHISIIQIQFFTVLP